MKQLYNYLKAATEGEQKKEKKHDMEVFQKAEELAEEYDIKYDNESFVPDDDELADSVFEAGIDLLSSTGVYCIDTERIIPVDKDDILKSIYSLKELEIGKYREKVPVPERCPVDSTPPVIIGGPMGGTVSEENFLNVHLSSAREPLVQGIYAGVIDKLEGKGIKPKSPFEMYAALKEARLEKLSTRIAGREGLALMGPGTPTISQAYMLVSADELYSESDPQEVSQLDELKTDYETFYKSIYHQEHGNHYLSGQCPIFGGTSIASAPGLAIVDVAETIQAKIVTGASFHVSGAIHVNTNSSSTKEVIWASSLSSIALSRNMNYYKARYYWNQAGCCTDMMFYETAAQAIADTVSGRDILIGPAGARGGTADHSTGLESRFMAEIAHMATDLNLSEANDIVSKIYSKYKDRFTNPPTGKPFDECYVVNSEYDMEPTDEYINLYKSILSEIEDYCGL
ncbi:Monomethylamine methyltransferase MtmB [Methanohalobium evestigatum Z-7303]|uniref:[methylamine--corrinoid protein] Co-methyltransferase n=1 Tax=Methanohalobium evestigatum (strain ATCC BAA-1072 / DSM 3721 / NBRC 107634 / OCM 161 / Z-7303) TaxID=644295 RepID=D7E9P8_METEZ|nr:monomethylamine:corrinoid methyltransferase [Methanohalobium evestigatum]ADI74320.1 Monomethylamine methyltransferase MtmB [Methanohalobium evestigatum Z-7303]